MSELAEQRSISDSQISKSLLNVLIRAGLIGVVAVLCYMVLSPFMTLLAWSIILSVTMYPIHQTIARRVGGREWLASLILVTAGLLLVLVPTALLLNSLADDVRGFVVAVQTNTLEIPAPKEGVQNLPVFGQEIYESWNKAHSDLPAFVQSMQPKIGELFRRLLLVVASVGTQLLILCASFILAGIIMAYGESSERSSRAMFCKLAGEKRGESLHKLSTATIRAVALGVLGVAFIQAIVVGLALLFAGVPAAGILAMIVLVLGIVQVPAVIVTLPAIGYIWMSGSYETGSAILHTIILLLVGLLDNVLKPLMLGRGVDSPMPVILLGALGGLASKGILGMFIGATVLALGYQIFMEWVNTSPDEEHLQSEQEAPSALSATASGVHG
jgi:predicted PurR-regulated permease PerM